MAEIFQLAVNSNYGQNIPFKVKGYSGDGGMGKIAATNDSVPVIATINFKTDICGFGYVMAFYFRTKGQIFLLNLVLLNGTVNYRNVKFVPGSINFDFQNSFNVSVSAKVEVFP